MFKDADKNKDGVLSRKEAREHWSEFDETDAKFPKKEFGVDSQKVNRAPLPLPSPCPWAGLCWAGPA